MMHHEGSSGSLRCFSTLPSCHDGKQPATIDFLAFVFPARYTLIDRGVQ